MEHKVLIADDSLTIQKVIKITLSNEPFAMSECVDADNLQNEVASKKPAIVLLDFNLSENKTGYDLAREIKQVSSTTQILMLYGAFDSIDESLLTDSGCSYHIVKPFDGTKFINLCRTMAQDFDSNEDEGSSDSSNDFDFSTENNVEDEAEIPDPIEEDDDADDWVVNQPNVIENDEIPEPIEASSNATNELDKSIEEWGMEIPGEINTSSIDESFDIPEVIDAPSVQDIPAPIITPSIPEPISSQSSQMDSDTVLPESDDLEYPDLDSIRSSVAAETTDEIKTPSGGDLDYPDLDSMAPLEIDRDRKIPSLVSANELKPIEEEIEVSHGGTDSEEALKSLEDEISDELIEDDLWAADEFEDTSASEDEVYQQSNDFDEASESSEEFKSMDLDDLPQIEPHNLEKVIDNTYDDIESEFDKVGSNAPADFPSDVMEDAPVSSKKSVSSISPEQFVGPDFEAKLQKELTDKLTPIVEEFVKEYCKNSIEKIAWEIIPDLAENVIKKEIQKISDSIMDH